MNDIKRYALGFKESQKIKIWDDSDLSLGDKWNNEIRQNLNEADIVLLFITPDFLLSDYIKNTELKTALDRHKQDLCRVIPLFIRRYTLDKLDDIPEIQTLQGFPKGKFFAELKEEKDKFYADLNEAIKNEVNEIRTNINLRDASKNNQKGADDVLQQENSEPEIRLIDADTAFSKMMKELFSKEIEGEKKHNKEWKFQIKNNTYSNQALQSDNSVVFTICIISSEKDINDAANYIRADQKNENQYKRYVLWIGDSNLEDKLPATLKSNKIVIGTMSTKLIEMIYLLEKERQELLKISKDRFSQQINVFMLYNWNQDHNNPIRISLKEKLENKSDIQTFFMPPPPVDTSMNNSMQEYTHSIEDQLQLSKGAVIFYGTADANWYCYWQSEVQKIYTLQSKAVCLSEPEKIIKLQRDVSKSAFLVMDDEQSLDEKVNTFVNNLKMHA